MASARFTVSAYLFTGELVLNLRRIVMLLVWERGAWRLELWLIITEVMEILRCFIHSLRTKSSRPLGTWKARRFRVS